MVLYSRRANRIGALSGAIVSLVLRLGGGEPILGIPLWIPYPWTTADGATSYFPFRTVAMLSGLATIWMVSWATAGLDRPTPLPTPSDADDIQD